MDISLKARAKGGEGSTAPDGHLERSQDASLVGGLHPGRRQWIEPLEFGVEGSEPVSLQSIREVTSHGRELSGQLQVVDNGTVVEPCAAHQ